MFGLSGKLNFVVVGVLLQKPRLHLAVESLFAFVELLGVFELLQGCIVSKGHDVLFHEVNGQAVVLLLVGGDNSRSALDGVLRESSVQLAQFAELLGAGDAGALGVILGDGDGLLVVVDDVAVVLLLVSHSVPFFLPFGISRIS